MGRVSTKWKTRLYYFFLPKIKKQKENTYYNPTKSVILKGKAKQSNLLSFSTLLTNRWGGFTREQATRMMQFSYPTGHAQYPPLFWPSRWPLHSCIRSLECSEQLALIFLCLSDSWWAHFGMLPKTHPSSAPAHRGLALTRTTGELGGWVPFLRSLVSQAWGKE